MGGGQLWQLAIALAKWGGGTEAVKTPSPKERKNTEQTEHKEAEIGIIFKRSREDQEEVEKGLWELHYVQGWMPEGGMSTHPPNQV